VTGRGAVRRIWTIPARIAEFTRDQVIYYQYKVDAARGLCGIDETGRQGRDGRRRQGA
jgi:hypothetical protein